MNSKVLFGLFFTLALLTVGCVSEFNAELPDRDIQLLFVDGNIVANSDVTFHLSKSVPLNSPSVSEENINANVYIIGGNGYKSPSATNIGKGAYRILIGELDDNVEYGIQIEYNGDIYQSTLTKPLHTPEIDSVSWIQPEKQGDVSFRVSTHDDVGGAKFFLWDYIEDWEITSYYYNTVFFNPSNFSFYTIEPAPYFYCWKNNKSNRFLVGSTESLSENRIVNKKLYNCLPQDNRFSNLYCVTVNQKAISKSAFEYYQNKIGLNEEMGGLFTPQPSELTGNIVCVTDSSKKVMGYVETIKNITQKRIFVYASEITCPVIYHDCNPISTDSIITLFRDEEVPINMNAIYYRAYIAGYRPAMGTIENIQLIEWSTHFCTECTSTGTKNKPDFWPNNHE